MTPRRPGRVLVLASWLGLVLASAPGCLVLGLNRFFDESAVASDDRLLGNWVDIDDNLALTIERSDWLSYRVSYAQTITNGQATAYLFRVGENRYVDLMPVRGQDPGVFTFAAHALARVTLEDQELKVAPLAYDWFRRRLESGDAPAELAVVGSERDLLLATAPNERLREWLRARPADDPAFGAPVTFQRAAAEVSNPIAR